MDVRAGMLLRRRNTFENQHQRASRGAHIDRLVAGVQNQHRTMQPLLMTGDHAFPPPAATAFAGTLWSSAASESKTAVRRSVRASVTSATCTAPARFNARAHAAAEAPVVRTSSTKS